MRSKTSVWVGLAISLMSSLLADEIEVQREMSDSFSGTLTQMVLKESGVGFLVYSPAKPDEKIADPTARNDDWLGREKAAIDAGLGVKFQWDEISKVTAYFEKFLEWAVIAKRNNVEPLSKKIGGIPRAEFVFEWVGTSGSKTAILSPINASPTQVEGMLKMIKGQLQSARQELAELVKKSQRETNLFR